MTREEREKAIDALKISTPIMAMTQEEFNDYIQTLNEVMDWLEQKPKTGKWIAQDIHNCHTDFKCSECGYIHSFMHLYGKPTADYTYCPNCGARMESEES